MLAEWMAPPCLCTSALPAGLVQGRERGTQDQEWEAWIWRRSSLGALGAGSQPSRQPQATLGPSTRVLETAVLLDTSNQ